jgi:chitinase
VPHAVLTMPVGPTSTTFPHVPSFYGTLAHKLDRIDVMTYGMAFKAQGWRTWHSSALTGAGVHTPTAVDVSVASYRAAGVPAAKLGVGIGFYGMCWAGGVTGPRQAIGSSSIVADDNVMSWVNIRNRYFASSAYHYDTAAQAPYLSYPHGHGPQNCTFVSYEDNRSIKAKARWARSHGLGALIVWTVNQGHLRNAPAGHRDPLLATARHAFGA